MAAALSRPRCSGRPTGSTPRPGREHVPFLFWLMDALRPFALVELTEAPSAPYLASCQAAAAYACRRAVTRFPVGMAEARRTRRLSRRALRAVLADAAGSGRAAVRAVRGSARSISSASMRRRPPLSRGQLSTPGCRSCRKRAVILVHGIDDPSTENEALELWTCLSEHYPHFEFVQGAGLGVLGIGDDLPPALQHLFSLDAIAPRALEVREMFARLGGGIGLQAELADRPAPAARRARQRPGGEARIRVERRQGRAGRRARRSREDAEAPAQGRGKLLVAHHQAAAAAGQEPPLGHSTTCGNGRCAPIGSRPCASRA